MPKQVKIKRYQRTFRRYRSPGSVALRALGLVAVVCALAFIGWSAYGPVMDFLSGNPLEKQPATSSAPATSDEPTDAPATTPPPAEPAPPALPEQLRAVYAPASTLTSTESLERFLAEVAGYEPNAVVFDLKDSRGMVLYRSRLEQVNKVGAQATGGYDLEKVCAQLQTHGLAPIGWMQAFRDPLAPGKLPDSGVTYMNSEMLWLDNAKDAGGKPWLNPYSDSARDYLKAIALEAASMGVQQILLDNLNFPIAFGGLEFATYGEGANGVSRAEALSRFAQELDAALAAEQVTLSVYLTGVSALGLNDVYYGGNPFDVCGDRVTVGVQPAQFGDRFVIEQFSAEAPILSPGETVGKLVDALTDRIDGKQVTGLVQGYTDARGALTHNRAYTAEDITAQIDALARKGVSSYMIYSADGTYPPPAA